MIPFRPRPGQFSRQFLDSRRVDRYLPHCRVLGKLAPLAQGVEGNGDVPGALILINFSFRLAATNMN